MRQRNKVRRRLTGAVCLGVLLPCLTGFAQRSSADYTISVEDLSPGNQTSASADFVNVAEFGVTGNVSQSEDYHSSALVVAAVTPVLSVQVANSPVSRADGVDFGSVKLGSPPGVRTLTVVNLGDDSLSIGSPSLNGEEALDFAIVSNPGSLSLNPGESAAIVVSFSPAAQGTRTNLLVIDSNDPLQSTLPLNLYGQGVGITYNDWLAEKQLEEGVPKSQLSGTNANAGSRLGEYAFGGNSLIAPPPQGSESSGTPTPGSVLTYTRRTDTSDLSYEVEVSDDLVTWHSGPAYTTEKSVKPAGAFTETVEVDDARPKPAVGGRFFRLKATSTTLSAQ